MASAVWGAVAGRAATLSGRMPSRGGFERRSPAIAELQETVGAGHIGRLLRDRAGLHVVVRIMKMIAARTEGGLATGVARRLFTREDYQAWGRMGALRPDERLDLMEGEIIASSSAGRYTSWRLRLNEAFNTERLAGLAFLGVRGSLPTIEEIEAEFKGARGEEA